MNTICKWRSNYNDIHVPILKIPIDCLQEIFYFVIEEKNIYQNPKIQLGFDEYIQQIMPLFVMRGNKKYTMNVFRIVCKKWNIIFNILVNKLVSMNDTKITNIVNQIPIPIPVLNNRTLREYSHIYRRIYIFTQLFCGDIVLYSERGSKHKKLTIKYQHNNDKFKLDLGKDPIIHSELQLRITLVPTHGNIQKVVPILPNYKREEFNFYNIKKWSNKTQNYKLKRNTNHNIQQPRQNNKY
jgi:hypothetical protein